MESLSPDPVETIQILDIVQLKLVGFDRATRPCTQRTHGLFRLMKTQRGTLRSTPPPPITAPRRM
jgi:hypothetical protein